MVSDDGSVEIYANLNRKDRFCAIVAATKPWHELRGQLGDWLDQLKENQTSYVEILLNMKEQNSIDTMLDIGFVPSALYPAMLTRDGITMEDYVVMSRSLEPLNFRGVAVDESFKPYIDQYIKLWRRQALESLEIIHVGG